MKNYLNKIATEGPVPEVEFQGVATVVNQIEKKFMDLRARFLKGDLQRTSSELELLEEDLLQLRQNDTRSNYDAWLVHFYAMVFQWSKAEKVLQEWSRRVSKQGYREGDIGPLAGVNQSVSTYRNSTRYVEIDALFRLGNQLNLAEKFHTLLMSVLVLHRANFTVKQYRLLKESIEVLPERGEELAHTLARTLLTQPPRIANHAHYLKLSGASS